MLTNHFGFQTQSVNSGFSDTRVLAANINRAKIIYHNPNAAALIYISFSRALPYLQCIVLQPNEKWVDDTKASQDEVYFGSNLAGAMLVIVETFGVRA